MPAVRRAHGLGVRRPPLQELRLQGILLLLTPPPSAHRGQAKVSRDLSLAPSADPSCTIALVICTINKRVEAVHGTGGVASCLPCR